jgi:tocopherol O-methyltransferase
MEALSETHLQNPDHYARIERFYAGTFWISLLHSSPHVLSCHFGFWEPHIRNEREAQLNTNRVLAQRGALLPGSVVLDAGCGVGGSALWLAENYDAQVTGINVCERQLRHARRAARSRGLSDLVSFEQRDYTATRFPDASFDVVWALESMCYALSTRDFLEEAFRVLRPGGRLLVADGFRAKRPFSDSDERLVQSVLDGWVCPDVNTPDELVSDMQNEGFVEIAFDDETEHVLPSFRRTYRHSIWAAPLARALRSLWLISPLVQQGIQAGRDQHEAQRRGVMVYGLVSAQKP